MKKTRDVVIFFILFLMIGLISCSTVIQGEVVWFSDEEAPNWGITLSAQDVSSTGLTLIINQSDRELLGDLFVGESYRLAVLTGDTWRLVDELPLQEDESARSWPSIANVISEGSSMKFDIRWNLIYGELPVGTYRLIKEISGLKDAENYGSFEYWVEFTIK